jgi:fatty acid desaturase
VSGASSTHVVSNDEAVRPRADAVPQPGAAGVGAGPKIRTWHDEHRAHSGHLLRFRADLRPLFFNTLGFVATAYAFIALPENVFARGLLFLALCGISFQGAVQTHNALHSPVFKSKRLNKIYQVVLTLTYGHPVSSYVPGHNLSHHRNTQKAADLMRTTKARFRWHLLNGLFFMLLVTPAVSSGDMAYVKQMRRVHLRWYRQFQIEFATLWSTNIALLILNWKVALVYWIVPHLFAQWAIVSMNMLQHDGCDADQPYNHSRNFTSPLLNWLTFNNGFHGIHHMYPGLHWSITPHAHASELAPFVHPALSQPSMSAYIVRTFVFNRREHYTGVPLVLAPAVRDEPWLPSPSTTVDDLGVEGV